MNAEASHPCEKSYRLLRGQTSVDEATRLADFVGAEYDSECRQATTMALTELAENIVKYSAPSASPYAGTIAIGVHDDVILIRAMTDSVLSENDAEFVAETIAEIASTPNVTELYGRRLRELFDDPSLPRAQLGMLRIAFEGGFRLSCSFDAPRLEIVAQRACGPKR
jgi:hypothetical protein